MAYNIINYKSIKIEDIELEFPKKIKGGSYFSLASYKNQPIYIQTPRLQCVNGILKNENRCSLELLLDKSHLAFYDFMTNIDDYNILKIHENSNSWFKRDFPLDVVEEFYKTPIKLSRNKQPPKLKLKIPLSKGKIVCDIYNNNKNITTYDTIKNNDKVICILQFIGLRFLKQQVICEWSPIQLQIAELNKTQQPTYLINDNFLSDIEDEEINDDSQSKETELLENTVSVSENTDTTDEKATIEDIITEKAIDEENASEEEKPIEEEKIIEEEKPIEEEKVIEEEKTIEEKNAIEEDEQLSVDKPELQDDTDIQKKNLIKEQIIELIDETKNNDDINLELNIDQDEIRNNNIEEILKETQLELNKYKELNNTNELKLNELKNKIQTLFNTI